MTLLFSLVQAVACAEVGVTLISPFAGRITDFYKKRDGKESYPPAEDPGVVSVKAIYNYYKRFGYKTVIMGASFRSKEQVMELAGCDLLTVAPNLLEELNASNVKLERKLDPHKTTDVPKMNIDEKTFIWMLNDDEMAENKLSEGIRRFGADLVKLEADIKKRLHQ
jgi:transaldolase